MLMTPRFSLLIAAWLLSLPAAAQSRAPAATAAPSPDPEATSPSVAAGDEQTPPTAERASVSAQTPRTAPPESASTPRSPRGSLGSATPAPSSTAPGALTTGLMAQVAVEGGLTSLEAGRRAAATSRQAAIEQQNVRSAQASVDRTFYDLAPRVTLTASYTRLSAVELPQLPGIPVPTSDIFPILLNNYFLNAGLVVPLSTYVFSTVQAIRGAEAVREEAALTEQAARVQAAAEARIAYYDWVRAQLQVLVAQQSLQSAEAQLERVQRYFAAGRVAQADVPQAEAFAANTELLYQQALTAADVAEQRLRTLMHIPDNQPLTVGEDVTAEFTQGEERASVEELYREAVRGRLEIRALDKTAYSLQQAVEVQNAQRLPVVEAFGNVTYANPNQRVFPITDEWNATWDVGVRLTWTLNNLGTANADAEQTRAQRAQVVTQRQALEDSLRLEILTAYRALREAQLSVVTAERARVAAEASYESRQQLYQFGRATTFELIEAETSRLQARLDVIQAHIALRVARVQLDHAVGRDVPLIVGAQAMR